MKMSIRPATTEDIPQMVEVDHKAWWPEVAFTAEQFRSQITRCPEGILVAETIAGDGTWKIIGTTCGLRISSHNVEKIKSWSETTGSGYFTTHDPRGDVAFGANLSVPPEFDHMGIGDKLFGHIAALIIRENTRYLVFGGRLPGLAQYNKQRATRGQPGISGEEYAALRDGDGRILDPELRFYLKQRFMQFVRVLPDYFPDPDSENYGVLLRWWNPLYKLHLGWIYRVPILRNALPRLAAAIVRAMV